MAEFEPLLARSLYDAELASWIVGLEYVTKKLSAKTISQIQFTHAILGGPAPPNQPPLNLAPPGERPEPVVRFPALEAAAESLAKRQIVTRDTFDKLTDDLKRQSFTVAYLDSTETIGRIRDALETTLEQGPSLKVFKQNLAETLDAGRIGPAHLENVYRTNLQTAFSIGMESIASNPFVEDAFPYQEYLPIRDARCRPEHLMLGRLGLNGTGCYRRDDPFWDYFSPPIFYNCRCGTNLLTIEAASRKGVKEAQEWRRTGKPPTNPEWRLSAIPFPPNPGWGARQKTVIAA